MPKLTPAFFLLAALAPLLLAFQDPQAQDPQPQGEDAMGGRFLKLSEVLEKHRGTGRAYSRFLDVKSMHCGVYTLKKGARDGQKPHAEDELYYVVKGVARFRCGEAVQPVKAGALLFVPARVPHAFEDIEEDLEILVIFSRGPVTPVPGKGEGRKL